jgi:hypothetical protein
LARILALLLVTTAFLAPTGSPASAAPDHFTPRRGVTFNSPVGTGATQRAIYTKIVRSINSSPRGSEIKIFTWNFLTSQGTDALLRAQGRGVRVRLLMDNANRVEVDNPPYRRLRAGLHRGNARWSPARSSWARTCVRSCRGAHGAAHAKFFMFSHAGRARRVVIQGSANLTVASTTNQWNDVYTHVGSRGVWDYYNGIFAQAAKDRPVRGPFAARNFRGFRLVMYPLAGRRAVDPVMNLLNKVRCTGATNTASHRTRIRIAPDVIRTPRGLALARKTRQLWNHGCDIRIGYTVLGVDSGRVLRAPGGRGPVPMKHLVQDFNGDGEFDNYFHLKAMTIVGNVGGDRSNFAVINGSANWSSLAGISDENVGIYYSRSLTLKYQKHLEYWYEHFPRSGTSAASSTTGGTANRAISPDRLVLGTGEDAFYEGGGRVAPPGVNPYAHVDMD